MVTVFEILMNQLKIIGLGLGVELSGRASMRPWVQFQAPEKGGKSSFNLELFFYKISQFLL
jgi:hypothetical protein